MAAQRPLAPQPQVVTVVTDDLDQKSASRSFGTTSTSQQDKTALEDARLRSSWEDHMKEVGGPWQPHRQAWVLTILWAPELDELKTSGEVERLATVFIDKFNYKVVKGQIESEEKSGKLPQHQVAKFLADFVYNHDREGSLLIIYYAGHGVRGAPGELTLAGSNKPSDKITERNAILWHEVENIVRKTRADVLTIFDCCFAGNLISHRSLNPHRNFEFLAATGYATTTPPPGPYSFTSALIWALEKLAPLGCPFSTNELLNQIGNEAPDFPKKQYPILKQRYELIDRRLMLAPIPKNGELVPSEYVPPAEKQKEAIKESLDLRFFFNKRPTVDEVNRLAMELKELMDRGAISTTRVGWVGLRSRDIVREAALKWLKYKRSSISQPNRLTLSPQEIESEPSQFVGNETPLAITPSVIGLELRGPYFHFCALFQSLTVIPGQDSLNQAGYREMVLTAMLRLPERKLILDTRSIGLPI